jgi:Trypsin-like peptidase domain
MTGKVMSATDLWRGIPSDRVVAVLANLQSGRIQIGSGYLVTGRRVLTAGHCLVDAESGQPAHSLRVVRSTDGAAAPAVLIAAASDVAVLEVNDDSAWSASVLEPVAFRRVNRSRSMELCDCHVMGFPLWQLDPHDQGRNTAELHGTIRATEDMQSGFLILRDSALADVAIPESARDDDRQNSPWGGLSGALVFYHGYALGVVVEHHPRQGNSALRILPVDRFADVPSGAETTLVPVGHFVGESWQADQGVISVAAALALPPAADLPLIGAVEESPRRPAPGGTPDSDSDSGPDRETITLNVIMRGPLQTQGLTVAFDEAVAREQSDPAAAAASFAEIAGQLFVHGFTPHADAMRRRAIQAYSAAGHRSNAIRLQLQLLNELILSGRWGEVSSQVLVLGRLADGPGETLSAGLAAAVASLQAATGLLEDPVLAAQNVSAVFDAAVPQLEIMLQQLAADPADFALILKVAAITAVTAAEAALAAEAVAPVRSAMRAFEQVADALGMAAATIPQLRIRLRLAIAEAQYFEAGQDGAFEILRQEATAWTLRDEDTALVFARYARMKAIGAAPADADLAWRRAVEFGGKAQLFSDTAGWLSAQWRLRHRFGPIDVKEIQDLGQMIQLLSE